MKSLYNEDFSLNDDGAKLDNEATAALEDVFARFVEQGYSPREISQIVGISLNVLELFHVLESRTGSPIGS